MSDVLWLTQEAFDTLTGELEQREGARRAEIVKRIELAREEGDLKENSAYHAAKDDQGHNEARIKQLRAMLEKAQVGTPESAADEAAHGKVITVKFVPLDMEETFLLASREEAPLASVEVYSPTSPLGAAVTGHKVGDTVTYALPNGNSMQVEILSVGHYSP